MSSGDKATIGVLFVVGTGLSAWAMLAIVGGAADVVEWIKLICGVAAFVGGLLMLLWPTLADKRAPQREPAGPRSAPNAARAAAQPVEGVEGYRVEYKILRRSYVTLAAAILATLSALFMIAFYRGNFSAMPPANNNLLVDAVTGGMELAGIFMGLAAAALWAGFGAPVKGLVLAGAILSLLSATIMLIWIVFSVPVTVLAFIGYARTGKPLAKYVEYEDEKK